MRMAFVRRECIKGEKCSSISIGAMPTQIKVMAALSRREWCMCNYGERTVMGLFVASLKMRGS